MAEKGKFEEEWYQITSESANVIDEWFDGLSGILIFCGSKTVRVACEHICPYFGST